jgi:Fur family ferric uptake transcriptional regulator
VLTQFEAAGLVARHHFEDGMAVFELSQVRITTISCMDCGQVEEFVDSGIEAAGSDRCPAGFTIGEHSLVIYGRCQRPDCPRRKLAGGAR